MKMSPDKIQNNEKTTKHTNNQSSSFSAEWRNKLKIIQSTFPSPWRELGNDKIFENNFLNAVSQLDKMKHPRIYQEQKAWQGYLGNPALPDYSKCKDVNLGKEMKPLDEVIKELVHLMAKK